MMFLNFETPSNSVSLCSVRQDSINSLLLMLGLTPGFIASLKLPQKKAIVFLASYAVDWRSCIKEYNDITLCLGQMSRREKALISGLEKVDGGPLDHAQHIRLVRQQTIQAPSAIWTTEFTVNWAQDRIEPKIDHLRRRSYYLNRGISAVAPPGVSVPRTVGPPLSTAAAAVPNHPLQPSGEVLSLPRRQETDRLQR